MIGQNATHLLDVNVSDGRIQGVPRPSPRVSRHLWKRLVLSEAKTRLIAVDDSLRDRVIAAYGLRHRVGTAQEAAHAARKPEAELNWLAVILPCSNRAELEPSIGHHGTRQFGLLKRRVTARRRIKHCYGRAALE